MELYKNSVINHHKWHSRLATLIKSLKNGLRRKWLGVKGKLFLNLIDSIRQYALMRISKDLMQVKKSVTQQLLLRHLKIVSLKDSKLSHGIQLLNRQVFG
jgi:hypothetical protein